MIATVGAGKITIMENMNINVWVIDYDNTIDSHNLITSLRKNATITSNWDRPDLSREEFLQLANETLSTTRLAAYIIIPEGFSYN
jgi:hypothetical protein